MSKDGQMPDSRVDRDGASAAPSPVHPLRGRTQTDADVQAAIRRGRRLQAQAIAGLFYRMGK